MKIREIIEYLKNDNESEVLNCNPPYAPTMKSLYDLIDSYWNSRFLNGDYDKFGWKKPFFNVVIGPTLVAAKTTDIDTKNITILAEDGHSYWTAYLLEKELKHWMKENHFGELLNQITYNRPKDGHVVLKKVGNKIYFVPLRNLYYEVDAEKFEKPIVELHVYSDIKDLKKQNWDKIDETIENYKTSEIDDVEVYEIWGEVDDDDFNYHIVSGLDIDKPVIHVAKNIDYPYKDLAWEKINGRTTGRGVVELLFESQIANNENEYHFRHGLQWSSKRLFQTRDPNAARNLISEKENGDVISVNSEITPIIIDERNLSSYQYSDGKWGVNAERLTFSQDVMRGDRPPSGTPLGTSALQAQMAGGFFELKREDLGLFIKEIVKDWIIPTFIKEKSKEHTIHIINLLGDDNLSEKLMDILVSQRVARKKIENIMNGKIISPEEEQILRQVVTETIKHENLTIPGNLYTNFKYEVDVDVTGESIDLSQQITTLQVALQMLGSNPTITQDPMTKKIFFELLSKGGVNPKRLESIEPQQFAPAGAPVAKMGGSMARAPQMGNPAVNKQTVTI